MLGLLLVDHGSRNPEANAQLLDMAERVRRLRPDDLVASCHLEIVEPSIASGIATLVAAGATRILLLPYFLSAGRHVSVDIPRLATAAASGHPGIDITVAAALGPHDLLARLLIERAGL
jgi:sirohydrochlorin ferrochelatase